MKASTSSSEKVLRIPSNLVKQKRSNSNKRYRMILEINTKHAMSLIRELRINHSLQYVRITHVPCVPVLQ